MKRLIAIDNLRGLVMIIMALDHVRDLLHIDSITQNPTDLATTTPLLFFTRTVTHLCAPTFVFLAGCSLYLGAKGRTTDWNYRWFLIRRGFWLIILEFTVVSMGVFMDPGFHLLLFEVIATIGTGMILLALVMNASARTLGIVGILILMLHQSFSLIPFAEGSLIKQLISPLLGTATFPFANRVLIIGYPVLPWWGIMLTGYACGHWMQLADDVRNKRLILAGAGCLVLFVIIRYVNVYGDTAPWREQPSALYTVLSFLNVTKYPPSLLFALITLGIMFVMLRLLQAPPPFITRILATYGRVPLFYFIVHFYIIHFILLLVLLAQGIPLSQWSFAGGTFGRPPDIPTGVNLAWVYVCWIGVVALLYYPCVWYGRMKASGKYAWMRYL